MQESAHPPKDVVVPPDEEMPVDKPDSTVESHGNDMILKDPNDSSAKSPGNPEHNAKDIEVKMGDKVDVSIIKNGIRSWWCAKVIATKIEKGLRRYRVQMLHKSFPPRWVNANKVRICPHSPQVASPHESVINYKFLRNCP